jgi:biopolymer transport protein ExbB
MRTSRPHGKPAHDAAPRPIPKDRRTNGMLQSPLIARGSTRLLGVAAAAGALLATSAAAQGASGGETTSFNLWERIQSGGPIMVPIGICSVVVLGIALERALALTQARVAPKRFGEELDQAWSSGGVEGARRFSEERDHALSRVVNTALRHIDSREEVKESVEAAARREIGLLRRGLRALAVMASISPLLGLLGTVGGMIDVFDRYVSVQDQADKVRVFSSGIAVALITTFAGLSVAIPATMLHQFFLSRVTRFADEVNRLFVEVFEPRLRAGAAAPARGSGGSGGRGPGAQT